MCKVSSRMSPPLFSDVFKRKSSRLYNMPHDSQFSRPLVKNVFHETESISYVGIYHILPRDILLLTNNYLV